MNKLNRSTLEIASLLGANPYMASDIVLDMLADPSLSLVRAVFVRTGVQYGPCEPAIEEEVKEANTNQHTDIFTHMTHATRRERILVFASGVWLEANRRLMEDYKNRLNGDAGVTTKLTDEQKSRFGIIEAIKFVRAELGLGLRDAKKLVDDRCSPFNYAYEYVV